MSEDQQPQKADGEDSHRNHAHLEKERNAFAIAKYGLSALFVLAIIMLGVGYLFDDHKAYAGAAALGVFAMPIIRYYFVQRGEHGK